MDIEFTVRHQIPRPVEEVFDAVADPDRLCSYFTKTASGPLEAGRSVHWTWHDGDEASLDVREVTAPRRVGFTWKAGDVGYETRVTISFWREGDGGTRVEVRESGWREDERGLKSSYEHCASWQHMLMCLRARLLFDIDLR